MRTILAYAAAFGVFMVAAAFAVSAFAGDGSIPVSLFLDPVRPYVAEVATIVIAGLVGWLGRRIHTLTGLNIEARHREALQSALENGARLVLDRVARSAGGKVVPLGNTVLGDGVEYVLRSVPDAVQHFGLSPERVGELIRPKLVPLV